MKKRLISDFLSQTKKIYTSRIFIVFIVASLMFSALVLRLFKLQIIEGEKYQEAYLETSTRVVKENYSRGTIFDRNGRKLAYNKLSYNVGVVDNGSYNAYQRNLMLMRLIEILDKHEEKYSPALSIEIVDGQYRFTTSSEKSLIRFLKDVGVYSTDEDAPEKMKRPLENYTPDYVVNELATRYGIGITVVNGKREQTYDPDPETLLKMIDMRYALALNSYKKYNPAIVAVNISEETVSDILEHEYDLAGVSIETDSVRTYVDGVYFAPIIGYTGEVSSSDLESLDDTYEAGDVIGKSGVEASYESVLKGVKGSRTLVVDSSGLVLSSEETVEAQAGNDVYLTIDSNLQTAVYNLLEQHLAGILVSKIVNHDVVITSKTVSSKIEIPVKDVYFQLINNNVLSMAHFESDDATETEKKIFSKYVMKRDQMLEQVRVILLDENSKVNDAYDEDMADTLNYIFNLLQKAEILKSDAMDSSSSIYKQWIADKISLRDFLLGALTNGWVDVTKLEITSQYVDTEETMTALISRLQKILAEDSDYEKKIYKYLIKSDSISGSDLCVALFDQGILKPDADAYNRLKDGSSQTAYNFIKSKIASIEITPAQLALDPCSGSVVMTDTKTGDVLALVTYPSYDNNRIASDSSYFASLNTDLSKPLYSRATQTRTAPGSIFKPITALAGMKEGVLGVKEQITTASNGIFTEAGYNLSCNISPRNHGTLGIQTALEKSCNYFFSEVVYRLAQLPGGSYNEKKGIEMIQKYSEQFGLGQNSGIEISEISPRVTDEQAVPSGIGQGTHSYTNTQINRYVTTIATRGIVYDLNLIKKTTDSKGNLIEENPVTVINTLDFTNEQWDEVYAGMHNAVYASSQYRSWFGKLDVDVAGKTGTAQEDKKRGNHANFICFAPYTNPEIAVSVSIPYGYTAANSVYVASDALAYYYGKISMDDIIKSSAVNASGSDPTD